jgi:hypothetical protein
MKLTAFFAAFALVFAGSAMALDLSSGHQTHNWSDGLGAYDCPGVAKWLQEPDPAGNLISVQYDATIQFETRAADDFMGDGEYMVSFGWWGGYWNGSPVPPESMNFRIWAKAFGDCPGELLYEENDPNYHETLVGLDADYCIELDTPFLKADGENYMVGIQPVLVFPPQTGWATAIGGNGKQVCFQSDYFAYTDWVPGDVVFGSFYECAMVLFNEGGTPVEESSWGAIKALYN